MASEPPDRPADDEPGAASSDEGGRSANTPRFRAALAFAAELHAAQWKKGTDVPYVAHLLGTCAIALEHGADEEAAIAALLHDAIEDQGGRAAEARIRERFGERVAAIVRGCSDSEGEPRPPWRERKEAYLAHLATADQATLLVSAADKLDNARRIVGDLWAAVPDLWSRFKGGREGSLWYYRSLVTAFRSNPAHEPRLVAELDRVVSAMEALASDKA